MLAANILKSMFTFLSKVEGRLVFKFFIHFNGNKNCRVGAKVRIGLVSVYMFYMHLHVKINHRNLRRSFIVQNKIMIWISKGIRFTN